MCEKRFLDLKTGSAYSLRRTLSKERFVHESDVTNRFKLFKTNPRWPCHYVILPRNCKHRIHICIFFI